MNKIEPEWRSKVLKEKTVIESERESIYAREMLYITHSQYAQRVSCDMHFPAANTAGYPMNSPRISFKFSWDNSFPVNFDTDASLAIIFHKDDFVCPVETINPPNFFRNTKLFALSFLIYYGCMSEKFFYVARIKGF